MRLEAKNLVFSYGERKVLDGLTFSVTEGSFTGVIGPNGSGKTTLFKLLTGVLTTQSGSILLDSCPLRSFPRRALAQQMAVVSQEADGGLLFTVEELVGMGRAPFLGRFQGESVADRQVVREALEMTGCLHLRGRIVGELSGGERQRVTIARALAQQPQVLLLDEPTSHLDIGYQQEILDLVKRLNASQGMTVLAVLHDLNLAAYYSDTLLLLHEGKLWAAGSPVEVITADNVAAVYRTRVLVTPHPVLGAPTVSFLPGKRTVAASKNIRVHVLAGGGSAGELLRDLTEAGFAVTTGVLNIGDSDWEAAKSLAVPAVTEAPFSPISQERHYENLDLISRAAVVVLAEIPVGYGNVLNLRAAVAALAAGKKVYLLEERPKLPRDFTGGEALEILTEIKGSDQAVVVESKARLYRALAELVTSGAPAGSP
ncbi:MAG: ABC transporter ATP-binding protein [Dethiobacter sp.]|nr:ABC transporter ATP-binding protein [Dethiobacter sp.]MCL5982618.1 ABC transporter ATP-binding protein [Bacillota bacterium]